MSSSPPAKRRRVDNSASGANHAETLQQKKDVAAVEDGEEQKNKHKVLQRLPTSCSAAAAAASSLSPTLFMHVSQWNDQVKQQRADADAQELYDAHVWPSHIMPWLQLLFSGGDHQISVLPSVLVNVIAGMALPPSDALAPVKFSEFVVRHSWRDDPLPPEEQERGVVKTFANETDLRGYLLEVALKYCTQVYELEDRNERYRWSEDPRARSVYEERNIEDEDEETRIYRDTQEDHEANRKEEHEANLVAINALSLEGLEQKLKAFRFSQIDEWQPDDYGHTQERRGSLSVERRISRVQGWHMP
jgi:hypothetical protein